MAESSGGGVEQHLAFERHFIEDLRHWVVTDPRVAAKVLDLMGAIARDPTRGIGKPELLKYMTPFLGMHTPLAALSFAMELRISEHPEPSHIHVPRPSRTARGPVQMQSACPANVCAGPLPQREERASIDTD